MRERKNLSKQRRPSAAHVNRTSLVLSWVALPLLCGVVACSGSSSDSKVSGSGSSGFNGVGVGGSGLTLPTGGLGGGSSDGGGSSPPGVYMLPAGFTMADMGGYKLGAAIAAAGSGGSAGAGSGGGSSTDCGTQILGVVRDFKGDNEPGGHPDFEHFMGSGPSLGIVQSNLGSDQKPVYSVPDGGPFNDPSNGRQTTSKMYFDEWYRATPNVNLPYIVYFYLEPNGKISTFQSTAFFPLDGAGFGNTPGQSHNFSFTTEVHTQFAYMGGESFAFTGDDDLWVFINNKLAIDLGGLHREASQSISLDQVAMKLGISTGNIYNLDLFHAERHTTQSNFRIDTNLAFTNCGTVVAEPVPR